LNLLAIHPDLDQLAPNALMPLEALEAFSGHEKITNKLQHHDSR